MLCFQERYINASILDVPPAKHLQHQPKVRFCLVRSLSTFQDDLRPKAKQSYRNCNFDQVRSTRPYSKDSKLP